MLFRSAIDSDQAVYRETRDDPAFSPLLDDHLQCILDVPFGDGTLGINSRHPHAFDAEDEAILRRFALVFGAAATRLRDLAALHSRTLALEAEIEARRTVEAELEASRERFRELVEQIPAGFYTMMADSSGATSFEYSSPFLLDMMGVTPSEAPTCLAEVAPHIHPEDVQRLIDLHRPDSTAVEPFCWEGRCTIGGQQLHLRVESRPTPLPDGCCRWFGIITDITEQRRREGLLQARLELSELAATSCLDDLMQRAVDIVERLTDSTIGFFHFVDENQQDLRLQCWSTNTVNTMCRAEGKGQHYAISEAGIWVECFHTRQPVIHNDYANHPGRRGMPEGHASVVRELVVPVVRGERVRAILGVGNKATDYTQADVDLVLALEAMVIDLVDRKHAEDQLHESQALLDEAQSIAHLGSFEYAAATRTTVWSAEEYRIYGLDPSRPSPEYGRMLAECIHPDDAALLHDTFTRAMATRSVYSLEHRIVRPDGTVRWVHDRAVPYFDEQGELVRYVGTTLDTTDRHQAEHELHHRDQILQTISAAAARLLGGGDWSEAVNEVLADLGHAADASRAYIFEYHAGEQGELLASQRFEWAAGDTAPQLDNPELLDFPMLAAGFGRWLEVLDRGDVIAGNVDDLPEAEQGALAMQGIRSILVVPIIAKRKPWGFLGLDECRQPRNWSEAEISAMRMAGHTLGEAIEQRRAEEALVAEATRRRVLIDGSRDGIVVLDHSGRAVEANRRFAESLGYTAEEVSQLHVWDWDRAWPPERVLAAIAQLGPEGAVFESRHTRKDGSSFDVELSNSAAELAGQKLVFCVCRDISERAQAASELRASEAKYRQLVENTHDVIYAIGDDGRFGFVSPVWTTVLGHAVEDVEGHPYAEFIHPDDLPGCQAFLQEVITTGQRMKGIEYRVRHADGTWRWHTSSASPIFDATGRVTHIDGIGRDITERRLADSERERLRVAIEQAADTIVITDVDGNIVYANPAFERSSGYTLAEAMGRNTRLLKSGAQPGSVYEELWHAISTGDTWRGRLVNRRRDGGLYTEDVTISPVRDASGSTVSYVAVKHDVSEALRMQARLAQAEKLESVGRLAGGVAHDFNNMLAVIIGNAEAALDRALDDATREDLAEVVDAANRSAQLTRQLLAFARQQPIAPAVLDLNDTVAGMLKMLQRLIGENISLQWHPCAGLWPVSMDPSQVDQVLANLCVNARDAIDDIGHVVLTTANCAPGTVLASGRVLADDEELVRLSVTDSGCGMDGETAAHAFEPFYSTKAVGHGTGLGLATVYGIAQQNGGFVEVESTLGVGTSFHVYLPRTSVCSQRAEPPANGSLAAHQPQATVLLVEDEPAILRLTKRALAAAGYAVLATASANEALALAAAHGAIDLLVTDVIMPEMNGQALAAQVLATCPRARCLFMSGYAADAISRHGVFDGEVQFLKKPFERNELLQAVARALLA